MSLRDLFESPDPFVRQGDIVLENGNSKSPSLGSTLPKEAVETWVGDRAEIMGRQKQKAKTNHNARSIEHFEKQGYLVFKVETKMANGPGSFVTVDFLGLFDFMAIKAGEQDIGIQVCAVSDVSPHLSKMTSTQITSYNKRTRIANLLSWIETGHRAIILGWQKVGSRWIATEREIDMAYVEKALARKRSVA